MRPSGADQGRGGSPVRGQSLTDFVIGVGLFLLALGYTFAFLPTVFDPFVDPARGSTQPAVRTADHLVEDVLAENGSTETPPPPVPAVPGLLNGSCTEAFFDDAVSTPPDECRYGEMDLQAVAGLPTTAQVNVTVRRHGSIVMMDGGEIVQQNGVRLDRGLEPPRGANVARSTRIATLDGRDVTVEVRVW